MAYAGGPVDASPKVVPVIFPGNALGTQIRDFFTKLAGSDYWRAATAEYGVGAITTLPVYVPTGPVPTAAAVDQWIADLAASGAPGLPLPDDNTIYAIVLPVGWGADVGACVSFGAYHAANYTASGQMVSHAVVPTCGVPYLGLLGIDQVTDALSHELEESATDPDASTGYVSENWAASGWGAAAEGAAYAETADMCEFQPTADYVDPQLGYMVQRIWSNEAAAAGHDPCVPLLPSDPVYFTAEPVLPEGTQVSPQTYARGISIEPGREVTIPVRLRSDGPIGEWKLSASEEPNPHLSPDTYGELSFSWDEASGHAGDTRYLTIKRSFPPANATPVFLRVAIDSTLGSIVHRQWLVLGTETKRSEETGSPGARHQTLPTMDTQGGAVLAQARVVPIFYSTDPLSGSLGTYFSRLAKSPYLEQSVREYGVSSVSIPPPVVLAGAAPASMLDTDIATWIAAQIDAGALPAEDGSTMYQVIYPAATQVLQGGLYGVAVPTCNPFTFEAYPATASGPAPFSVVPLCEGATGGLDDLDAVTTKSGAGIADVLTQPFSNEAPAYVSPSWNGSGWGWWVPYGVGDLCGATLAEASTVPEGVGFRLPRIWSNRAVSRDGNPCADVLAPREVYFNAAPDIGGAMPSDGSAAKAVILPGAGGQVTIPVRLYSDGPTGEWTLRATERTDLDLASPAVLSFSFDEPRGRSGDVRLLTITRAAPGDGGPASALAFEIASTLGGATHEWIVTVGND